MNVASEHQKVMYKKKLLEDAKQRAEQGEGMGAESIQLQVPAAVSPSGYSPNLSPEYTSMLSPGYTSIFSPPVEGTSPGAQGQVQFQQPLSFGQAVMSMQGQQGQMQPRVLLPNPLVPVMVAPAQGASAPQGILSVEKKPDEKEGDTGDKSPKKTVLVNLSP
jgi:hypothetical protein